MVLYTCCTFPSESKWKVAAGSSQSWIAPLRKRSWQPLIWHHFFFLFPRRFSLSIASVVLLSEALQPARAAQKQLFQSVLTILYAQTIKHATTIQTKVTRNMYAHVTKESTLISVLPFYILYFFPLICFCICNDQQTVSNMAGNYTEMSISLMWEDKLVKSRTLMIRNAPTHSRKEKKGSGHLGYGDSYPPIFFCNHTDT